MKKKILIIFVIIFTLIITGLIIYPHIEFYKNGNLYKFTYSSDFSEWEQNMCYSESYSYNEKRDISIYNWDFKEFLFFKMFILEYKNGNVCETEYLLEEEYIQRIINEAEIVYNDNNIDLSKLIAGKKAIVGNTRYLGNDYETQMTYILDNRYEDLFVFYKDNLLIIQVGLSDEGPKFIAYE